MCRECINHVRPDRSRTCMSSGAYMVNFTRCKSCGKVPYGLGFLGMDNRNVETTETDDESKPGDMEEVTTYNHKCSHCGHVVCEHYYSFSVDGPKQIFMMDCFLCGRGADEQRWDIDEHAHGTVHCVEKLEENKLVDESMMSGFVAVANSAAFGAVIDASRDRDEASNDGSDDGWDD